MTKISDQGVSKHIAYTINELAEILGINEKTVRRWLESGLQTVPGRKKPALILGSDLKAFLRGKNEKRKVPLKRHEFYCFTCKAARRAKRGSIEVHDGKKAALCSVCNGKMSRTIKPSQNDYTIPLLPIEMSVSKSSTDYQS